MTHRENEINRLMSDMPKEWRDRWCEPGEMGCACLGCANNSGGLTKHGFSKEEWEKSLARANGHHKLEDEMQTALEASLKIDMRRERARQYAAMLVHELAIGGYIADRCRADAECHLAAMFERNDVEITTEGQRRAEAVKAGRQ